MVEENKNLSDSGNCQTERLVIQQCCECGTKDEEQAVLEYNGELYCLDCLRLMGICLSCKGDMNELVDDYWNYEDDICPECLKNEGV